MNFPIGLVYVLTKKAKKIHRGYLEEGQAEPYVHESCNTDQAEREVVKAPVGALFGEWLEGGYRACRRCFPDGLPAEAT